MSNENNPTLVIGGPGSQYPADSVQRALGRPPRQFGDLAREAAAAGAWDVDDQSGSALRASIGSSS